MGTPLPGVEVCIATEALRSGGRSYTVHARGDEDGTQVVLSCVLCCFASYHEKFPPPQPLTPRAAGAGLALLLSQELSGAVLNFLLLLFLLWLSISVVLHECCPYCEGEQQSERVLQLPARGGG